MKTLIYYYTGTGNSLWTARYLSEKIGTTDLIPMKKKNPGSLDNYDAIGFVFPVHMWGVPVPVVEFVKLMQFDSSKYYFAYAVNAGQVSRTLIQLKNILKTRGIELQAGYDIALPSNYIPWGGPGSVSKLQRMYKNAQKKIDESIQTITSGRKGTIDKGPLWQRIVFTALYKMTYRMIPKMDRDFWVDDNCNSCGICEKICPVNNISMDSGKPVWHHHCEQCLACIQWCPKVSIQYGKKTSAYDRYHHPEVKLKDVMG
jgi:ferredoxin